MENGLYSWAGTQVIYFSTPPGCAVVAIDTIRGPQTTEPSSHCTGAQIWGGPPPGPENFKFCKQHVVHRPWKLQQIFTLFILSHSATAKTKWQEERKLVFNFFYWDCRRYTESLVLGAYVTK